MFFLWPENNWNFPFFPSGICVLQFLCVRSWDWRLELACLGAGWPTAPQASPLMSFPRKQALQCTGHQLFAVLGWNCCVFLLKLWCLFLAKPCFNLVLFILSVLVDRRAAGNPGTKYGSLNSLYVSFGGRFAPFGWHHPVVCDSL